MHVSYVTVINWVKKAAEELRRVEEEKSEKEIEVLELDEMYYKFKNIWLWTAANRESKQLIGYEVGTRETKYFEKLSRKIHTQSQKYVSDKYEAYNLIDTKKRLIVKFEIMDRLLRNHLARFRRKTYC